MIDILQAKDLIWSYVLPLICLLGLVTNSVNLIVFYERRRARLRNRMHQYFQIDSLAEFAYLFIGLGYFVLKSRGLAAYRACYLVLIYEKYFYFYFSACLASFMIFLRLFVSVRRLLIVLNSRVLLRGICLHRIIIAFFVFSLVFNLPLVFDITIIAKPNLNETTSSGKKCSQYEFKYKRYDNSWLLNFLILVLYSTRGVIAPVVLLFVNVAIVRSMKSGMSSKRADFKNRLLNEGLTTLWKSLTKMLIVMNFLFLLGNVPILVSIVIATLFTKSTFIFNFAVIMANLICFSSHCLGILVYYNYDHVYRDVLIKKLKFSLFHLRPKFTCHFIH